MDMQGSRQLSVTQQQAWDALNDPEVLKVCIPGCEKVEKTADNQYAVAMAVKIGPVSAKFNGRITLSDIVAPKSYTIGFEGQGGAAGHGKGSAKVDLAPVDDPAAGCLLSYVVNAQVGGKIAQLGQRLIDGAAKSMAEDFFKRFDQEMQRRHAPVAMAPANATAPATVTAPGPATVAPIAPDAADGAGPHGDAKSAVAASKGSGFPVWAVIVAALLLVAVAFWLARSA